MFWNTQLEIAIEQAIKLKFPHISGLTVSGCVTHTSVTFDDDGIHTRSMVEEFIKELKGEILPC